MWTLKFNARKNGVFTKFNVKIKYYRYQRMVDLIVCLKIKDFFFFFMLIIFDFNPIIKVYCKKFFFEHTKIRMKFIKIKFTITINSQK